MNINQRHPPREFEVGFEQKGILKDCGAIHLEPNEQITFVTAGGHEYDLARKDYGFYATSSLNGRLVKFALRAVLVRYRVDAFFVLLVEKGKELQFQECLDSVPLTVVCWMDNLDSLKTIGHHLTPD